MAKFEVSVNGKVVETYDAERYLTRNGEYVFKDKNARTVGSIVWIKGMSVKEVK